MDPEYEKANQEVWNRITPVHLKSYGIEKFKQGKTTLDEIQRREMGNVRGKTLLHLQCRFGLDTLAWAREGAIVTGVDFAEDAIKAAEQLKNELKIPAKFIASNVYDLRKILKGEFDIVYTSKGVLVWLKDIEEWARIVFHYLKPGGFFYVFETHPLAQMFEEEQPNNLELKNSYFHSDKPHQYEEWVDYADESHILKSKSYEWRWSLSDVVNSLIKAGLTIKSVKEYDKSFYKLFPGMAKEQSDTWYEWWYYPGLQGKIPFSFSLLAKKEIR